MMRSVVLFVGVLWVSLLRADAGDAELGDLAWIAGNWRSEQPGGLAQEIWSAPQAGVMTGMFRLIDADVVRVLEYLIIRREDGGIFYLFKHFRPDYTTWEGDGPPIRMELIESGPGRAVFRNTREIEGQPSYISYLLGDDGLLTILVGEAPVATGDYEGFSFVLSRQ